MTSSAGITQIRFKGRRIISLSASAAPLYNQYNFYLDFGQAFHSFLLLTDNMTMEKTQLIQKLREIKEFSALGAQDLEDLVSFGELFSFEENTGVYFPGDPVEGAFFVLEGSLRETTPEGERSYLGPKDNLCLRGLIWTTSISNTVQGYSPGILFYLSREQFLKFIKKDGGRRNRLIYKKDDSIGFPPEVHKALKDLKIPKKKSRKSGWDLEQEIPILSSHPSGLTIIPKCFLALLIGALSIPLGEFLEGALPQIPRELLWLFPGLILLGSITAFLAIWGQWKSDRLILTTEFLIRKRFLFSQKGWEIYKVPLDQIQSMSVSRSGFWNFFFKLNNLEFTTSAEQGNLSFPYVEEVSQWEEKLKAILEESRKHLDGLETKAMREFLSKHWPGRKHLKVVEILGKKEKTIEKSTETKGPHLFSYRWREGDNLFFRRHPIFLIPQALLPITIAISLFFFLDPINAFDFPGKRILQGLIVILSFVLIWLGLWRFWDWTLDRFMVGKHFLMDWDKKPLWFGEEKKQTELENIQSVTVEKKGLWSLFFNYGNVRILTAGEDADLCFENVPTPEIIQHEIFFRRSQNKKLQYINQRAQRIDEWSSMMKLYDQERRLGVIP